MLVDLQGAPLHTTRHQTLLRALSEWVSDERVFATMVREMGEDDAGLIGATVGCSMLDADYGAPELDEDQVCFLVRALLLRRGEKLGDEVADRESTGAVRKAIVRHERRNGAESLREAVAVVRATERLAGGE